MNECDRSWQPTPCDGDLIERTSAGGFITATCEHHLFELEDALAGIAERYPEVHHPNGCLCSGCTGEAW